MQPDPSNDVRFGEQGALLTYGSYLRLGQLLDAQHLESDPPAHDELLFITIHQVYELWFQQLLHEAETIRDALVTTDAASGGRVAGGLRRVLLHRRLLDGSHGTDPGLLAHVVVVVLVVGSQPEVQHRSAPHGSHGVSSSGA